MTPWLSDPDVTLYHGDAIYQLSRLEPESVDCCVTSPPYWGLRDYGTGAWEGGDAECDHKGPPKASEASGLKNDGRPPERVGQNDYEREATVPYRDTCGKCGATRIDQQLGLEPTPEQYVERMVEVFREVRRVLAAHGTVWLNLGDSYVATHHGKGGASKSEKFNDPGDAWRENVVNERREFGAAPSGLKPKDLVGIPWRVAFALQADGWWLRSAITWCKPNCMPESVTDRPTKATEMVFLLTKASRYYYDAEALREEAKWERWGDQTVVKPQPGTASWIGNRTKADLLANTAGRANGTAPSGSTLRPELRATFNADDGTTDTWGWCDLGESEVAVPAPMADEAQGFEILKPVRLDVGVETAEGPLVVNLEGAGLATANTTMPVALQSGLAALSPVWASVVDAASAPSGAVLTDHVGCDPTAAALARTEVTALEVTLVAGEWLAAEVTLKSEELGATLLVWGTAGPTHRSNTNEPAGRNARDWWVIPTQPYPEAHFATFPEELARRCIAAGCPEQGVVLDPFVGSGTVCFVARKLHRRSVGIDLNESYLELAARRLQQQSLFAVES